MGNNADEPGEFSSIDPLLEAARVVGQVYQGCGDAVDAHRMLGLMIMVEHFISGGGDAAGEKMGWEIQKRNAPVTSLELVRKLASETPLPQER